MSDDKRPAPNAVDVVLGVLAPDTPETDKAEIREHVDLLAGDARKYGPRILAALKKCFGRSSP